MLPRRVTPWWCIRTCLGQGARRYAWALGFIITTFAFLSLATVAVDVLTFSWRDIQRKRVKVKTENSLSAIADELYLACETRMGTQGKTEERDMERESGNLVVVLFSAVMGLDVSGSSRFLLSSLCWKTASGGEKQ
ncbi:hypothetical protein Ddc_02276 [Ditylenchus destructor]|nr:hypothetical protein Ddc_02276 [Ditylenchus destructor]